MYGMQCMALRIHIHKYQYLTVSVRWQPWQQKPHPYWRNRGRELEKIQVEWMTGQGEKWNGGREEGGGEWRREKSRGDIWYWCGSMKSERQTHAACRCICPRACIRDVEG